MITPKCYNVGYAYKGEIFKKTMEFVSDTEYLEYIRDKEKEEENELELLQVCSGKFPSIL